MKEVAIFLFVKEIILPFEFFLLLFVAPGSLSLARSSLSLSLSAGISVLFAGLVHGAHPGFGSPVRQERDGPEEEEELDQVAKNSPGETARFLLPFVLIHHA